MHDLLAAKGVNTFFVNHNGMPFTPSSYSKYVESAIKRQLGIDASLVPRTLRYIWATAANEGGIPDSEKWDVALLMGHHKEMWDRWVNKKLWN